MGSGKPTMLWFAPSPRPPDDRIVIVGITEADVSHFETSIFSDAVLADLINQLKAQQPVAIGLDLYRNVPVPPGTETLHQVYESTPNLIGIEKVAGTDEFSTVAPPPILQQATGVKLVTWLLIEIM